MTLLVIIITMQQTPNPLKQHPNYDRAVRLAGIDRMNALRAVVVLHYGPDIRDNVARSMTAVAKLLDEIDKHELVDIDLRSKLITVSTRHHKSPFEYNGNRNLYWGKRTDSSSDYIGFDNLQEMLDTMDSVDTTDADERYDRACRVWNALKSYAEVKDDLQTIKDAKALLKNVPTRERQEEEEIEKAVASFKKARYDER